MSNLMQTIRGDIGRILTDARNPGIAPVLFSTPSSVTPAVSVTVNALPVNVSTGIDPNTGAMVESRRARVTVSEAALTAASYPVRNSNNKVSMKGHLVSWSNSAGVTYNGTIITAYPDETTGNIVFDVADYTT